uniref:Centromere protein S-like n=1 Tax=Ciona intestinalis TaxID=7719 RepID=F7B2U2_CIOIN|nr:uncharacterized protein LOC100185873 isoform X1 [Ciona intestinalis]|eukprot:XP_002129044.1 uncharacterized protein LOC100185873 isoform X1 [Ciona intestinalis]
MNFSVKEHSCKDGEKSFQIKQGEKCKLTIQAKQGSTNAESSWGGSVSVYTGAFVMLLHVIFHSSVGHLARLTVGVCFVVEFFFLVSFLNKYLSFTLTVNIYKILFVRKILITCGLFLLTIISAKLVQITLNIVTFDEFLLMILPSLYLASHVLPLWIDKSEDSYLHKLPNVMLVALLAVYW